MSNWSGRRQRPELTDREDGVRRLTEGSPRKRYPCQGHSMLDLLSSWPTSL